jgi:hypothetical protein
MYSVTSVDKRVSLNYLRICKQIIKAGLVVVGITLGTVCEHYNSAMIVPIGEITNEIKVLFQRTKERRSLRGW